LWKNWDARRFEAVGNTNMFRNFLNWSIYWKNYCI
jgi:hypothetical protein